MSTVLIMLNSSSGALIDQLKPSLALVSEEASSSVHAKRSLPMIKELEESTDTLIDL